MRSHSHEHASDQPAAPTNGKTWTCPMHPEVISNESGRCPICRMFLVEVPPQKGA